MVKNSIAKKCGISLLASVVFFTTYYGGLLFDEYIVYMAIAGGLINIILISDKNFFSWAEKVGIYAIILLSLSALFQAIDMHLYMAELFSVNTEGIAWGERQLIANCIWFGQAVLTTLIALAITLIMNYIENKNIVE